MPTVIAAAFIWLICLGLTGGDWFWLIAALAVGLALALKFRLRPSALAQPILLTMFFAAIAWLAPHQFDSAVDWSAGFEPVREAARQLSVGVSADARALVLGLATGDDSLLSDSLQTAMKTVSLTHLTAVSGANCAIVVASVYFVLVRFATRVRVVSALLVLTAYVLLVGFQPSVLRAATMTAAVLLAVASGRGIKPIVALALSICVLLAISPSLVLSLSFILSVCATLGLLWFAPIAYRQLSNRFPKWLAATASVSISAQLFCLPVLLQLQSGISTYALPANLLVEPLVAPITVLGLLAVSLTPVVWVSSALFWLASCFAAPIVWVASFFAGLPFATIPWAVDQLGVILLMALVISVLFWFRTESQRNKNLAAISTLALSIGTIAVLANQLVAFTIWPDPRWQVASCDVGQGDATVVRSANRIALIDTGKSEPKINTCLSHLRVRRIDLLVLTHYDLDHIGALSSVLDSHQVVTALITSYQDERPAAGFAKWQLQQRDILVTEAETGLTGRLGSANWQVLNPDVDGGDAEDSNDGSIAMQFNLDGYNLLALADLGERAQMRIAERFGQWHDDSLPLVLKVAHHGSADQYPELIEALHPAVTLISVGPHNGYGHPTARTLHWLNVAGSLIARTDLLGSVTVGGEANQIAISSGG